MKPRKKTLKLRMTVDVEYETIDGDLPVLAENLGSLLLRTIEGAIDEGWLTGNEEDTSVTQCVTEVHRVAKDGSLDRLEGSTYAVGRGETPPAEAPVEATPADTIVLRVQRYQRFMSIRAGGRVLASRLVVIYPSVRWGQYEKREMADVYAKERKRGGTRGPAITDLDVENLIAEFGTKKPRGK